jgi:hypothetical protein
MGVILRSLEDRAFHGMGSCMPRPGYDDACENLRERRAIILK